MKITRAAAIPLVTQDPYISIWSGSDHLYDADTMHWSGIRQRLTGNVVIDGTRYCFLGDKGELPVIEQTEAEVTATATRYQFANDKVTVTVQFTSPLLLEELILVSRPCTYVDFTVMKKSACQVQVEFGVTGDVVLKAYAEKKEEKDLLIGCAYERAQNDEYPAFRYASMGRAFQKPLGNSGDNLTIDWGYVYLAAGGKEDIPAFHQECGEISCTLDFAERKHAGLILAYDDLCSINYFGEWRKGYWTKFYPTILDAIAAAQKDRSEVLLRAAAFDAALEKKAEIVGGPEYAYLCSLSYRHSIAAHKLIEDEDGKVIFLSKENDSNGCIGTVDVSYPSVPLYLLYNPELVKGMLRPVFRFAECDVWEFDFAPHDVGRYPYAWGQVYGLKGDKDKKTFYGGQEAVFPPFFQFPKNSELFEFRYQMPVEECGNMLLMTAAVCRMENTAEFAKPYLEILKKWTGYLEMYGEDPGEQLCTDDFAGHMAHNVNLSAKAIMGVQAYAQILTQLGENAEAQQYHKKAKQMAQSWERRAAAGDHYMLSFEQPESWSLKYNLVWDQFFGSKLFHETVYETETAWYIRKCNEFGVPLDSRESYTKSDWILWCAAMTNDPEQRRKLIAPVANYLEQTPSRYPFADWYETISGSYCHFKGRSVQGGIYMPLLLS